MLTEKFSDALGLAPLKRREKGIKYLVVVKGSLIVIDVA